MAGLLIQLTELPKALTINDSDLLHIRQGTTDKAITFSDMLIPHTTDYNNPHRVTKDQVGLGNVENALQLIRANNLSDIPNDATARTNLGVYSKGETDSKIANHANLRNNPHAVTKAQVGLGNVSNALQLVRSSNLGDLASTSTARTNLGVYSKAETTNIVNAHANLRNNPHAVTKAQVGLGSVANVLQLYRSSNFADVPDKGAARSNLGVYSTSQTNSQIAAHANLRNNPHAVTKAQVGLSNVPNYPISNSWSSYSTTHFASLNAVRNAYNAAINYLNSRFPVGMVVAWHGSKASIPSGWRICDGGGGTPNTVSRFIRGNNSDSTLTQYGGTSLIHLSSRNIPAHNHTFSAYTNYQGNHTHNFSTLTGNYERNRTGGFNNVNASGLGSPLWDIGKNYLTTTNRWQSAAGNHRHYVSGTTSTAGQSSVTPIGITNPYVNLYYIKRIST